MSAEPSVPFLRTLAPMLRGLERRYQECLDARRRYPWPLIARAELEGVVTDLKRKSESLDAERPLLVVMLMGGTGVGKSTLMNALAGAAVAQASFTRPTTRDPVVYFHQSIHPDKLDPAMRLCKLVRHDRDGLRDKVIVDTPDVDSNDLANRDKLIELLPNADVVLYVGSQEKYHDQIGWELFKEQRRRRAFAFVLNKWDRCRDPGATGLRPDEDLLRDLKSEGFDQPKLFRTTAQLWVDQAETGGTESPADLPPGEQFRELSEWLEQGLTRMEIDAVKARGVDQLLAQSKQALQHVVPPDFTPAIRKVEAAWDRVLNEEAEAQTEVLVGALEPFQHDVEQHFSTKGHQRFRGLMAGWLRITTKLRYVGSALRDRFSLGSSLRGDSKSDSWDLQAAVHTAARAAGERVLAQRMTALTNRLLVETEQNGLPMLLVNDPVLQTAKLDWDDRITRKVIDSLTQMEAEVTKPTGRRKVIRESVGFVGNFLPEAVLIGSIALLLYRFFVQGLTPEFFHVLLPVYVTVGVLIVLHVLILTALPVRWSAIRGEFGKRLDGALNEDFRAAYRPILSDTAAATTQERRDIEQLVEETLTVTTWLNEREQASQVNELYGR